MSFRQQLAAGLAALLSACVGTSPGPEKTLTADIRRTEYGVPHIKADSYAGLGFGLGYASAEDNICELAERHPDLVTGTAFVYRRQPAVAAIKDDHTDDASFLFRLSCYVAFIVGLAIQSVIGIWA